MAHWPAAVADATMGPRALPPLFHLGWVVRDRDATIEDLNSTNGVLVNGRRVSRQLLHHGDLVVIGEIQFRFVRRLAGTPGQAPG